MFDRFLLKNETINTFFQKTNYQLKIDNPILFLFAEKIYQKEKKWIKR